MNRTDLRRALASANVSAHAYGLEGPCQEESYCLEKIEDAWHVYYAERGLRTGERVFSAEGEACDYLLGVLLRDPTTRRTVPGWPDHDSSAPPRPDRS